jgi:hypothetical protein
VPTIVSSQIETQILPIAGVLVRVSQVWITVLYTDYLRKLLSSLSFNFPSK